MSMDAPVEQTQAPAAPAADQKPESVTYDTHRRLLDEKKKVQAELEVLRKEKQERDEAEARKRGDYEALLKSREEELARTKREADELKESINHARKVNAIVDALGGSIESKWLRLIDPSAVIVHPETGQIDPNSVAQLAESLKKEWPEMFRGNGAKLPADAPKGNDVGKIARSEWLKLSANEMRKYKPDQIVD